MFKKFAIILITTLTLVVNSNASSDGELLLKKNNPSEVKDCFEGFNRATFAFNQALDGIIFKPVASAYRVLPSPIKTGVSNSLDNLSTLVTIPNNIHTTWNILWLQNTQDIATTKILIYLYRKK